MRRQAGETEAVSVCFERGDDIGDDTVKGHAELFRAADDVLAANSASECFVFHFLFYRSHIDIMNTFCRSNERDSNDEAAYFIDGIERFLKRRLARDVCVIRVR